MICAMASSEKTARRVTPATIALALAAVLALVAIGIAIFRSGETADAPPGNTSANAAATAGAQPGNMEQMIAAMREQLRQDPDNHERWYMLGLALRDQGTFAESAQAFRRAMELSPTNADYTAYLAEMLLLQGGRNPPPEAERLLRRVLELQPGNPQARYYLATLKDMRGDHRGAVDDLITLLREAPADAPWEAQVREAVETIARTNNIDIGSRLPPRRTPPANTATSGIPGPTREQMEQAKGIAPGQQDEMVRGMVDRLAARLRQNPRDADGWIRLMRSRMVLNDRPAATEALRSGLAAFANDAATQTRIRQAAEQLGVPAG